MHCNELYTFIRGALAPCITATTFPVKPKLRKKKLFPMGFTEIYFIVWGHFLSYTFELSDLRLQITKRVPSGSCVILYIFDLELDPFFLEGWTPPEHVKGGNSVWTSHDILKAIIANLQFLWDLQDIASAYEIIKTLLFDPHQVITTSKIKLRPPVLPF